jgi:hypothetical protein
MERDFLQWGTVSLMSLLGVYVIIGYYNYAEPNPQYRNKITKQLCGVHTKPSCQVRFVYICVLGCMVCKEETLVWVLNPQEASSPRGN